MAESQEMIPLAEAKQQVELVCRRLGLLHLAFAETLVKEFGQEKGKKLTARAISAYSKRIAEAKKKKASEQGLSPTPETMGRFRDIPTIGMHERAESAVVNGETRRRAYGCVMGRVWHEAGQDDLGKIYCYVDPASAMFFNPDFKIAHTKALPDGDPYCELVTRPTTPAEREELRKKDADWAAIDRG